MAKLAIAGGKPVGRMKVPRWPAVDDKDIRAVTRVLREGRWCRIYPGSWAEKFEKAFADWSGAKYAIAASNGTVTLQLGLKAGGVGIGDEVIVPAVTFIATASAVEEVGAVPVFADSDPDTMQISPEAVESAVTRRTRAIIAVHYGGYPADLDSLRGIARKKKLLLIEDCAHAHGTRWRGRGVGTFGDFGSFSMQESKSLTAGEGGVLLAGKKKLFEEASVIHNIGRVVGKPGYGHYYLSSNYRLSEIQAALLLSQMRRLESWTDYKHRMGKYLAGELRKIGGVDPLPADERITRRGYYYFVIKYDAKQFGGVHKDKFIDAMKAEGIPCHTAYGRPLYRNHAFRKSQIERFLPPSAVGKLPDYRGLNLPVAEDFCRSRQVVITHHVLLSEKKEIGKIIQAVRKIKENKDELRKLK